MKFPKLADNAFVTIPTGITAKELFIACVKYLAFKEIELDYRTHGQWASFLFKNLDSTNAVLKMSKIKGDYSNYFLMSKGKYTFDIEKIVSHFGYLFKGEENQVTSANGDPVVKLMAELMNALANELKESKQPKNLETYRIENLSQIKPKRNLYECDVKTKNEEIPHFREGLPFRVSVSGLMYDCEVVDYELDTEHLYFTTQREIGTKGDAYAIIDTSFIIGALRNRIVALAQNEIGEQLPVYKFINKTTQSIATVGHSLVPKHIYSKLDKDQLDAFRAAINNDLTFIWGPPGTGKSYTLASIIRALYEFDNERTAVCCVSNVAVDELAKKVIEIINDKKLIVEAGNFYRSGRSTDDKINSTDYLFPKDNETIRLREEIKNKLALLENLSAIVSERELKEKVIAIKAEIKDLRGSLKTHTEYLVGKSRVVFSTIANFIINEQITNSKFDNLIVDEASMLALPQLLALAKNVSKRIILVGDFQQLSPISLIPDEHLRDNVFKIAGIDINHTNHKALRLLTNQRRSHEKIVEVTNHTFYQDKLKPTIFDKQEQIVDVGPFRGRVITTRPVPDSAYRYTKGGTRQNKKSAEYILSLLQEYNNDSCSEFSIGVITPYKGQVSLLKALLLEKQFEESFVNRLKIGTIHTFQGSECDVIIYDIVDCDKCENDKRIDIGKIYCGEEGEQLMNVALSRARHKLIIVGDAKYFDTAKGAKMTHKTLSIFRKLQNYTVNRYVRNDE